MLQIERERERERQRERLSRDYHLHQSVDLSSLESSRSLTAQHLVTMLRNNTTYPGGQ